MAGSADDIADLYRRPGLLDAILGALQAAGKPVDALAVEDLAPVDEFHIRGSAATFELGLLARIDELTHVLDIGCGIGGPARRLASTFGCRVTGLDLSADFVQVARQLTRRCGLAGLVDFECGDATAMPFADGAFDLAWTQHASMNIADKPALYREIRRVLAADGRLAFYDVAAGTGEPVLPLPWALSADQSFLATPEDTRAMLSAAGFTALWWQDVTQPALDWFRTALARGGPRPPLGPHLVLGAEAGLRAQNLARNLEEGRLRVIQAVLAT